MPVNPTVLAAIAQPVDYPNVNLSVLAAYTLAGMQNAGGSVNDDTGETTGDDPRDLIQGEIIRGTPYTATDMAYFEYLGWGPKLSPYRWHGESNTFSFDATLVGQPNHGYGITQIPMPPTASVPAPRPEVPPASPIPSPMTNGMPQAPQIISVGHSALGAPSPFVAVVGTPTGRLIAHFGETLHAAIMTALAWIEAEAKKL